MKSESITISESVKLSSEKIKFEDGGCLPWNPILWEQLRAASDHDSILRAKVTLTKGNGFIYEYNTEEERIFFENFLEPMTESIAWDLAVFGGFQSILIGSKDKKSIAETYHQPIAQMRIKNYVDYPEEVIIKDTWVRGKIKPTFEKTYKIANPMPRTNIILESLPKESIYYHFDYSPGQSLIYPSPTYISAENALKTAIHHSQYNLKIVENGFFPSVIIQIENMPDQFNSDYPQEAGVSNPEYKSLMDNIKSLWMGTENAAKAVIIDKKGEKGIIIDKVEATNNVDLLSQQEDRMTQKIMTSHAWNPILAGFSGTGTMSGNAGEMSNAISLALDTIIKPQLQNKILKCYKNILRYNGFSDKVVFAQCVPTQFIFGSDILLKITKIDELRKIIGFNPLENGEGQYIAESSGIKATTVPISQNETNAIYQPIENYTSINGSVFKKIS